MKTRVGPNERETPHGPLVHKGGGPDDRRGVGKSKMTSKGRSREEERERGRERSKTDEVLIIVRWYFIIRRYLSYILEICAGVHYERFSITFLFHDIYHTGDTHCFSTNGHVYYKDLYVFS